jgi:hypothetical protein
MGVKNKIYDNVLKTCEDEYNDKIAIFNQLDSKAQQIAGFSGVLLGVLISFCKLEMLKFLGDISIWCLMLCLLSVVLLMVAIGFAIFSMKITKVIGRPAFNDIKTEFDDLCRVGDSNLKDEHYLNFISSQIRLWEASFESLFVTNERKAKCVHLAQIICGCGLLLLGLIAIVIIQASISSCQCN